MIFWMEIKERNNLLNGVDSDRHRVHFISTKKIFEFSLKLKGVIRVGIRLLGSPQAIANSCIARVVHLDVSFAEQKRRKAIFCIISSYRYHRSRDLSETSKIQANQECQVCQGCCQLPFRNSTCEMLISSSFSSSERLCTAFDFPQHGAPS